MPFVELHISVETVSAHRIDENGDEYLISDFVEAGQSLDPERLWILVEETSTQEVMEELIDIITHHHGDTHHG